MTSGNRRELLSGKFAVDAPSAQRRSGAAIASAGALALPTVLSVLEPGALGGDALAISGALLVTTAALYFGGLAIAAAAGKGLAEAEEGSEGALYERDDELVLHCAAGSWALSRRALRGAFYDRERERVILSAEDDLRIAVTVGSEQQAARLLAALGHDRRAPELALVREGRAARVIEALAAGVAGLVIGLLTTLIAATAMSAIAWPPFGAGSLLTLLAAALVPVFVTIRHVVRASGRLSIVLGTDGALVRSEREPLFLAYDAIDAVETCERGVIVRTSAGAERFVPTVEPALLASALAERVADEAPRSNDVPSLARCGATASEWRARLAAFVAPTERYRVPALSDERLLAVVDDPHAEAEERIAAAFVLARRGGGAHVALVRVAADSSAHPALRAALHAAADGELEARAVEEARAAQARRAPTGRALGPAEGDGRPSAP